VTRSVADNRSRSFFWLLFLGVEIKRRGREGEREVEVSRERRKMASFGKLTDYFNRRKSQEELRVGRSSQRSGSYCCTVAEAR